MVSPPLPAFDESMPDWLFEAAEEMGIDTTIPVSPPPPRASTPPPPRASTPPPPSPPQPQQFSDSTAAADKRPLQPLPLNSTEGPRSGAKTLKRHSTTAEHDDDGGLASGLARLDATMKSMEAEVATRRLEQQLSACQSELEASEAKRTKQEKVLQRLMRELREEKVRAAAKHNASALVERLREEVLQKVAHASARVVGLHECVQKDLGAAAERLCASAAADEARATARVGEMEAAMAAARMGELAAHEARGRSEARAAALEARVDAQARLVASLLRQQTTLDETQAAAEAERLLSDIPTTPPMRDEDTASASPGRRLIGALAGGVMRVASAAYNSTTTSNTPPTEAHYTGLLEHELGTALSELSTTKQIAKELETELSTARLKACGDDQASREEAAALAAAEAAADALFEADGMAVSSSSDAASSSSSSSDTRQRAAAAALLEELRLEGAKSQRLEKIISRLMSELRTSKVEAAAGGGGGRAALASFTAIGERVEGLLRDNAFAFANLNCTLRKGLDSAAERVREVEAMMARRG